MRFVVGLFFSVAVHAAVPPVDGLPPEGFLFVANVPYGVVSESQRLDILYHPDDERPRPAIVHIHGGGWYTGGKGGQSTLAMLCRFAEAGFVALSIDYRLSDEATFPAAIEDCKLAIRWLRAHAAEYNVDPDRIGVIGGSAGGHLSAMLAVTQASDGFDRGRYAEYSSEVQAAVPVCGPMDLCVPLAPDRYPNEDDPVVVRFLGGPLAVKAEAARRASPIAYVRNDSPPMLLIHGDADNRVILQQSRSFAEAAASVGASCELLVIKGGGHGMAIAREGEGWNRLLDFFFDHLR